MTNLDLGPTESHAERRCTWLPATPGDYPDDRMGTLTVTCKGSSRTRGRVDSASFAVDEQPYGVPGKRLFLLCKLTGGNAGEIYQVLTGPVPASDECTCTAGRIDWYRCRHRDAMRALIEDGALEPAPVLAMN